MPIEYSTESIFDCGADVLVCPVNCVGVMGKGLALKCKRRFPFVFTQYVALCREHKLTLGKTAIVYGSSPSICLFPTKYHWRTPSNIDWINAGLNHLTKILYPDMSVAIPALGCGLGGLPWPDVRALIEKHFADWPGRVIVFPPKGEETVSEKNASFVCPCGHDIWAAMPLSTICRECGEEHDLYLDAIIAMLAANGWTCVPPKGANHGQPE